MNKCEEKYFTIGFCLGIFFMASMALIISGIYTTGKIDYLKYQESQRLEKLGAPVTLDSNGNIWLWDSKLQKSYIITNTH